MSKNNVAKAILEGNDACALSTMYAAEYLLGPQFVAWEPETIRLELDDRNIAVLDENFDALMASITLTTSTAFFWHAYTFENVCMALNSESPQFDVLHELCPAQIAWGVLQAHLIVDNRSDYDIPPELKAGERFDYEPVEYTAATCLHAGLVTAPDTLLFAREYTEEKSCASGKFISKVKKAWSELDRSKLSEHPFSEDAVGVQLALLATVDLYIREQRNATNTQINLFQGEASSAI